MFIAITLLILFFLTFKFLSAYIKRIRTGDRRNPYRSEGVCNCGTAFDVPHIYVEGSE